ncbi:MAG: hypothetical protein AAB524_00945 [Patescibacteria group bacterium]
MGVNNLNTPIMATKTTGVANRSTTPGKILFTRSVRNSNSSVRRRAQATGTTAMARNRIRIATTSGIPTRANVRAELTTIEAGINNNTILANDLFRPAKKLKGRAMIVVKTRSNGISMRKLKRELATSKATITQIRAMAEAEAKGLNRGLFPSLVLS